jgi:hypothetical protein
LKARLEEGDRGEFSVWLDGRRVARRWWRWFPGEGTIVRRVRAAL